MAPIQACSWQPLAKKKFREQTRFLQRADVAGERFYIWTLRRAPARAGISRLQNVTKIQCSQEEI